MSLLGTVSGAYAGIEVLTGCMTLYQLGISSFGITHRSKNIQHDPQKRFALLVPCHNEEMVLAPLLESLLAQKYPTELYDVHVVADNCTDATAALARSHGVWVHERTDASARGKGYAVQWVIEQLRSNFDPYDAIILFDADNIVDAMFVRYMNEYLCRGSRVIQGYLDVKNPYDSWVSVSLAVTYWFDNRLSQNARANLGLPCSLGGTGLCIAWSLLDEMGWHATGLTEDLEFGVRCVKRGIRPTWAHEARVFDEKPTELIPSFRQRLRWQQGHFLCAKQYMLSLLTESIRERNFAKFDTALYLFQPMRSLILFLVAIVLFAYHFSNPTGVEGRELHHFVPSSAWLTVNVLLFVQIPFALILERVNWRAYFGLFLLPIFLWTWGPVTLHAFFTKTNRNWYHTAHKRAIRLDEIQSD